MVQIPHQIPRVHNSVQYALHLCSALASQGLTVWRGLSPLCTWVFPRGGWTSCWIGLQVRAHPYAMRMLSRATTQAETTDRKRGRTEASTGDFWPFFKNSHCLYAKSLRIWKPYQVGSNAIYSLLTMTRSRYLQKCLRQGNACRDTAQNILPASNNPQGRDSPDRTGCACIHHPSTDFSGDSLNSQRPLSPSTSRDKEFHRACSGVWRATLVFTLKPPTHWFPSCACTGRDGENHSLFSITLALRSCLRLSCHPFSS